MQLGLGIIGYGGFGTFTADIYARMPQVRIVAVTDVDAARCEAAATRYQARAYPDLTSLLANPQVNVVSIATPPWLHTPQAIAAIEAGKHVFLEKPLSVTLEEANRLLASVQRHGLRLSIDYVLRHVPLYRTLLDIVHNELFGRVTYISLENVASNEALHTQHWFWERSRSGGILVEHGVHFFDLCTHLVESEPVSTSGYAHVGDDGRQDRVLAIVSYANGTLSTFYHAFDRAAVLEHTVLRIVLEHGSITVSGWIPERLVIEGMLPSSDHARLAALLGSNLEVVPVAAPVGVTGATEGTLVHATLLRSDRTADYADAVRMGMAELVQAILDPTSMPSVTTRDAYESLRLALAAQQSIDEQRTIALL